MTFGWDDSRTAFADAAASFVRTAALVGDRWGAPGLDQWDVRSLVGHTSRSLLTVEAYLDRPAEVVEVESAVRYFRVTSAAASAAQVAQRGRDAGTALGAEPVGQLTALAQRVVARVDGCDGGELVTTVAGGMRLSDYLPTRTFELVVHTADLAVALGRPLDVPHSAAGQALHLVADLAVAGDVAGPLLLAATGRPPRGPLSVL